MEFKNTPGRKLILNAQNVNRRSVDDIIHFMAWSPAFQGYMVENAGKEHYRMLAEISHQLWLGSRISDVGTFCGASALALSSNPNVLVTTYDIESFIPNDPVVATPLTRPNVVQKIMSGHADISNIAQCDVVLLDIDPHDGPAEMQFVNMLIEHGFRGVLVCDDIHLNDGMRAFWGNIPRHLRKIDASHLAHWSGTGMVVFDPSYLDVQIS